MQMRDDLGITTKLENGKAYLEFALPEKRAFAVHITD